MRIDVETLSVRYRGHLALDSVSLSAQPGEVLGIIGPNGSGKSTLLKAIAGVTAASGHIRFDGSPNRPAVLGYMPQGIEARVALSVLEVVLLGRLGHLGLKVSAEDLSAAAAVMDEIGISALAARDIGALSGGQRQLVFLAQALASNPSVLILDEPLSALDIRHQLEVSQLVRRLTVQRCLTTLIVLHDLARAAHLADRIGILREGRLIAAGEVRDVLTKNNIKRAFDVESVISHDDAGLPQILTLSL
mgnify:CR=1 FL=1